MRVLVTGATGFIGGHVCRALVGDGHAVRALVRPTSDLTRLPDGVGAAVGDVTRPDTLAGAVGDVDAVVHLAAMLAQPWHPEFERTNADGVRHLLGACAAAARPPRVVVVSSVAAVGPSNGAPLTEDSPPRPVSAYGRSKLAGEAAARALAGRVPVTIVRPPVVFGPGDREMLPAFRAVARGLTAVPTAARASLVHVEDLARLCVRAITAPETLADAGGRGIYFAGADEAPAAPELVRLLGDAVGRPVRRVVRLPAPVVVGAGVLAEAAGRLGAPSLWSRDKVREVLAGDWVCSTAKARAQLGWAPAASLADRLADTAAWYRARGWLPTSRA